MAAGKKLARGSGESRSSVWTYWRASDILGRHHPVAVLLCQGLELRSHVIVNVTFVYICFVSSFQPSLAWFLHLHFFFWWVAIKYECL